jgi:hypothetical protein
MKVNIVSQKSVISPTFDCYSRTYHGTNARYCGLHRNLFSYHTSVLYLIYLTKIGQLNGFVLQRLKVVRIYLYTRNKSYRLL